MRYYQISGKQNSFCFIGKVNYMIRCLAFLNLKQIVIQRRDYCQSNIWVKKNNFWKKSVLLSLCLCLWPFKAKGFPFLKSCQRHTLVCRSTMLDISWHSSANFHYFRFWSYHISLLKTKIWYSQTREKILKIIWMYGVRSVNSCRI